MTNHATTTIQSAADLKRMYPEFVAQIRAEAAAGERARLKQLHCAVSAEDGQQLMIEAAARANAERRARPQ